MGLSGVGTGPLTGTDEGVVGAAVAEGDTDLVAVAVDGHGLQVLDTVGLVLVEVGGGHRQGQVLGQDGVPGRGLFPRRRRGLATRG